MLSMKIDPRMKAALQKVADRQFISVSAAVKQAVEAYLKAHGIDWRSEEPEKPSGRE